MKTIELKHPLHVENDPVPAVAALGFFDGIHQGHKKVIKKAVSIAEEKNLTAAVMTFNPHPKEVLRKEKADYLITLEQKKKKLAALGVELLYIVQFNEQFASLSPQQFIDQYLIGLNVKHVVAGFDFTYGQKGKGTMESFSFHARGKIEATTVEKWTEESEKVSSSAIREALKNGDTLKAARYLGEKFQVEGPVIHGEKRGRTIGFPTANIEVPPRILLPSKGVYAVKLKVKNKIINGVANIGVKPTFHEKNNEQSLEVYLFDFQEDIYDEYVTVFFYEKLRGEEKFNSVDELVARIKTDVAEAERILTISS